MRYTCKYCGYESNRYEAITHRYDKGGYILHEDSLIWHFLNSPECNKANSERIIEDRRERENQEYHEMMDML